MGRKVLLSLQLYYYCTPTLCGTCSCTTWQMAPPLVPIVTKDVIHAWELVRLYELTGTTFSMCYVCMVLHTHNPIRWLYMCIQWNLSNRPPPQIDHSPISIALFRPQMIVHNNILTYADVGTHIYIYTQDIRERIFWCKGKQYNTDGASVPIGFKSNISGGAPVLGSARTHVRHQTSLLTNHQIGQGRCTADQRPTGVVIVWCFNIYIYILYIYRIYIYIGALSSSLGQHIHNNQWIYCLIPLDTNQLGYHHDLICLALISSVTLVRF